MIRSIVVPLDGSSFGEHALPLAASIARRSGAVLYLVHVHQVVSPTVVAGVALMDSLDLHLRQDEQAYLSDVVRRVSVRPGLKVEAHLIESEVVPALHAFVDKVSADLVVMSTHGRGALGRFWLGGVADELVRELLRPVLVVRPGEGLAELTREHVLKNIVVPLDGTPFAEQVVEPALNLGQLFEANVCLVRVIKPVLRPSYMPDGSMIMGLSPSMLEQTQMLQQRAQEEAQKYLDDLAGRLQQRNFHVQTHVIIEEQAAAGILMETQMRHADLIAIETHGRGGLSRLLRGSVADKIVRGGVVPVLLNRPKS